MHLALEGIIPGDEKTKRYCGSYYVPTEVDGE